ncbi:MAG: thioredoxin domain-containing protein [Candidatus Yanofskybacteria bacterium]|nr:thioredoxin domain-containing protein [Candidatus Yanofskybacteria bacterium]
MENDQQNFSSKETYEQKRQAKEAAKKTQNKGRSSRRVIRWLVFILGLGLLIWGMVKIGGGNTPDSGGPAELPKEILAGEWSQGLETAPLTLIEYADFQCPACASYHPLIQQLQTEFGDKLRFGFRHFPLRSIHKNADAAAYAAEAASKQGKFWEMHNMIFENQDEWSSQRNPEDKFVGYARSLNLDEDRFKTDLDSDEIKNKIDEAYNAASKAGLTSTPTFILNGTRIQPRNYEEFKTFLDQKLAQ